MANEKGGVNLLLQVETATDVYALVGGLRSKSFSFNSESIEVTNHGSDEWKTLLDGNGIRSVSLSGSGVHNGDADTLDHIEDSSVANALTKFRVMDADNNGRTYTGLFKIVSFERAGEYNGEQTYSISLESSGEIDVA